MRGGGLNFADSNPALGGMSQAETVIGQQQNNDLGSMRIQELQRTRDVEHAIDQAIREQMGMGQPAAADGQPGDLASQSMGPAPAAAAPAPSAAAPGSPTMRLATPADPRASMDMSPATPNPGGNAIVPVPNAVPGQGGTVVPMGGGGAPVDFSTMAMDNRPQSQARVGAGIDRVALAKRLAQIDGGGTAALQQLSTNQQEQQAQQDQDLKRQDYNVTNYFKSLENGDTYSAKYWGKQAGMEVSDDVLHDADFQKFMGTASKWKEFYGSDLQGFHDFYQTALKLHAAKDPDAFQKAYQANPPTVKAAKGAYDDRDAEVQKLVAKGYTQDQAYAMVGMAPDGSSKGGRGAHSGGVAQWKYDTYLKLHPGDENGALAFSNGQKAVAWKDAYQMAVSVLTLKQKVSGIDDSEKSIEDQAHELAIKIQQGDDEALDSALGGDGAPGGDVADQMRVPKKGSAKFTAQDSQGNEIYSNGQGWYDGQGNAVGQ